MSLLFATGFGLTTAASDLFESELGPLSIGAVGRNGGSGLQVPGNDNRYARKNLGLNASTIIVGVAVNPSTLTGTSYLLTFDDNGTVQASMRIQTDGQVILTGTSETFVLPVGIYSYLEVKLTVHGAAGAWVARVNGVEVLNETGLDTQATGNSFANQVRFGGPGSGSQTTDKRYDDIVIMDSVDATSTQGAPFNDFLGDIRVDALMPEADGDSSDFTPSTGTDNYAMVDEVPPNDDTDYVSSSTVGHKDLYALPDLPSPSGEVKGVVVTMRARKDDAGTRTIRAVVKRSGTEAEGPDISLSTDYAYYQSVFGVDPSTSSPWTIAAVNAMQAGTKVVA